MTESKIVCTPLKNGKLWGLSDDYIFRNIATTGDHETNLMSKLRPLYGGFNHVLDIGAHIGIWTLDLAPHIRGKVFAFEPQSRLFDCLGKNIQERNLDNIITSQKAILHVKGQYNLSSKWEYDFKLWEDVKSVGFVNYGGMAIGRGGEACETDTLDHLFQDHPVSDPVDFIKMDVECSEYLVIHGGKQFLKTHKPALLFEYRDFQAPFARQWMEILKATHTEREGLFYPDIFGVILRELKYTGIRQLDEVTYYAWGKPEHELRKEHPSMNCERNTRA